MVLLNCVEPRSTEAQDLREELAARYEVPVIALSCPDLEEEDIRMILAQVLYQFPVREVAVELPGWIVTLPGGHWLKNALYGAIREGLFEVNRISELPRQMGAISDCEHVDYVGMQKVDFGTGKARMQIAVKSELFFRVLCEATGMAIQSESELIPLLMDLVATKNEYEKYRGALEEVSATGYGIVMPTTREMSLETPEIVKQGGRYGVRLRASAPSIHMMRRHQYRVSPIVGSEQQSEDLVSYLMEEFETDPIKIWDSNIFGKSLQELVSEGCGASSTVCLPMPASNSRRPSNGGQRGLLGPYLHHSLTPCMQPPLDSAFSVWDRTASAGIMVAADTPLRAAPP